MKISLLATFSILFTSISIQAQTPLQQGFQHVPDSIKPSVYYYWLSDNISEQGVKKDIEAMAKVGIGRAFIGNIGLNKEETSYGKVKLFSDEWWKVTKAAVKKVLTLEYSIAQAGAKAVAHGSRKANQCDISPTRN